MWIGLSMRDAIALQEFGFPNKRYLVDILKKQYEASELTNQLRLSDAVRMGTAAVENKKNASSFNRWHRRVSGKIRRLLNPKVETQTVFKRLKGKSTRL